MPIFYFDYGDDDGGLDPDTDGSEFPNIEAAYINAYHAAIDMWAEARHQGRDVTRHRLQIRDELGRVLLELPFTEVLGYRPPE
jgi:hypothetical protein